MEVIGGTHNQATHPSVFNFEITIGMAINIGLGFTPIIMENESKKKTQVVVG